MLYWRKFNGNLAKQVDPSLVSRRNCPICGENSPKKVFVLNDFQYFSDSNIAAKRIDIIVVQCDRCWAIYLNPVLSSKGFRVLLSEAGCSYGSSEIRTQEQIAWLFEMNLLLPGNCLLDVGCYDGRFLAEIPASIRRMGVDIDYPSIQRGRNQYAKLGMELFHEDLNNFSIGQAPDVITMFHVLEHLPDPVDTLANIRSFSKAHTKLVIEVPILESGFTNDINGFMSVQHMTHFSRKSLINTLARAGWEIVHNKEQFDYNGFRVIAQPSKIIQKVIGCKEDTQKLDEYLTHWRGAVAKVNHKLAVLEGAERILVWGGGLHTEFLFQLTNLFQYKADFVMVDSDPIKQGKSWRGISITSPSVIPEIEWEKEWLLVSSYGSQPSIVRAATELGVPIERLLTLYDRLRIY